MASRLADSASPYLRAHAGNPVAWFPWGEAAFDEARRRDVPLLISIGYSTCHWCHVMARESFEDPRTAQELNDGFVAVKVDREEHPEVDEAYLAQASAFTANLGWPLTVFATPHGRAFFAGTYFPPLPRPGLPAFRQVIAAVSEAWTQRRGEVEQTAADIGEALAAAARGDTASSELPDRGALVDAARRAVAREDREFGGFAPPGATMETPKFPTVPVLRFLQSRQIVEAAPDAAQAADRALAAMAASPLRDVVDGGFFRYATRRDWTVPHFERMLTDNAGLIDVALDAGRRELAGATAGFLRCVLQQAGGGFAAAQDSESWIDGARDEGGYYGRDAVGRALLEPPAVDGKIVTGWNGLAIAALSRAGVRLGDPELIAAARWAADAVLESNIAEDGSLVRASLDEIASRAGATLEDYGLLAGGLVALAVATGEVGYARKARALLDVCLTDDGLAAPGGGDPVLAREGVPHAPSMSDGASPSGPSAAAAAALDLWLLGAGEGYRDAAAATVRPHSVAALAEPLAHGSMLREAARLAVAPRQVVVVTDDVRAPLASAARALPADVLAVVSSRQAEAFAAAGFTLFEGKTARDGAPTVYDCHDFTCRLPVTRPEDLARPE